MFTAASTLFYQDEIADPYVGSAIFFGAVLSYTLGLALSIYLDRKDPTRKANDPEQQSVGAVLKPALLGCLVVVILISIVVVFISEYAKSQGVF